METSGPLLNTEIGPYRCMQVLGEGINHKLYHAIEPETDRLIALRVIPLNPHQSDLQYKSATLVRHIQAINSAYTVPVIDFGIDDDVLYIASPDMPGGSLESRFKRFHQDKAVHKQGIPWPSLGSALYLVERIAHALDDVHSAGYVHGLVDPINIMFDKKGHGYLGELGISQLTKLIFRLGDTNSLYVSRYAAPELWQGNRPQPASDQYSLACLAYELFTGELPFSGQSIYTLMKQHTEDAVMPPRFVRPELPDTLTIPFWRALAKPMEERYGNVGEFVDDLREALPDVARDVSPFFTEPL
ncbi:serine/threonine protein kinase [Phototrophicus methaneseepsis]|uniref:non-specific serine/threonine protein kinase n=1 Tax=Phototrophicus methaneseepsis TaxID=2710758 RepID=A0A7S8ECE9_9CHLR|nr:serine/threonine-protein kinase [Phototrophicus methaneseepsis]QPC84396.1 serine/threonine protein kinase [Phototrophicus methaneseepsis]